jgi:hypothetical protein
MRTVLASFVLATAIATPGVVVAAISSGGHSVFFGGTSITGGPVPLTAVAPTPVDPALRPAVRAVKRAFAAKGIKLIVDSTGSGSAEAFDFTPSAGCPTIIVFRTPAQHGTMSFGSSCSSEGMRIKGVTITYTPASAGPTIRRAVAGLPR